MRQTEARHLLGLSAAYDHAGVEAAFRGLVRSAHPDHGGTDEAFNSLVEARATLLNSHSTYGRVVVIDRPPFLRRIANAVAKWVRPNSPRVV